MPFIGNQPTSGRFLELDSLTASATDDYTLQLNGANFSPESVNNLLVSINGVIQGSSTMSLNGAVLTVGATLSSSDTIDFVRVFGNVGTVSTPTDGSVTANKIGTGAVTSAKIADGTIVNGDINASAGIAGSKLGTGAVLQVVQNTSTSVHSNTATDWASTGFSVTITPKATSSKILLNINATVSASANAVQPRFSIFRGTTNLGEAGRGFGQIYTASGGLNQSHVSTSFLDSPNTTNATTYTVYMRTNTGTYVWGADGGTQTFIAQEIGG